MLVPINNDHSGNIDNKWSSIDDKKESNNKKYIQVSTIVQFNSTRLFIYLSLLDGVIINIEGQSLIVYLTQMKRYLRT